MTEKCEELKSIVEKYDTESFAGFFAYFLRQGVPPGVQNKLSNFESRLKDFLYLIALNSFSENRGQQKFDLDENILQELASRVAEIKAAYHPTRFDMYSMDAILHEMAFQNYFHNGTLSYIEQDLEKIRRIFMPFNDAIQAHFGIDVETVIEIYKYTELIFKIRMKHLTDYARTEGFIHFQQELNNGRCSFNEGFEKLPEKIQDDFLNFHDKPHTMLFLYKSDLYLFDHEKVTRFLALLSFEPEQADRFLYYTDINLIEEAPILKISDDKYLHICQKLIPFAIYNRFYRFLLSENKYFDKVRQHRDKELEKKVKEIFTAFFKKDAFFYENYSVLDNHEQDLLILHKGVALIVEIKASKIREPFRDINKAVTKIKDDFKASIQKGYDQCLRVERLFASGAQFDIRDMNGKSLYTVHPKKYHTVFSIVVTLERWGALQTDLSHLLTKEESDSFPWSVFVDDLETFLLCLQKISKNPVGNFVSFLKDRQKLHGRCYAIDELDICSEYLMDTKKFANNCCFAEAGIVFSPKNQNLFDRLYHARLFKFKEKALPDASRYFEGAPKDWDDAFSDT